METFDHRDSSQKSPNPELIKASGSSERLLDEAEVLGKRALQLAKSPDSQKLLLGAAVVGASWVISERLHLNVKSSLQNIDTDGYSVAKWLPKSFGQSLETPVRQAFAPESSLGAGRAFESSAKAFKESEGHSSLSKVHTPLVIETLNPIANPGRLPDSAIDTLRPSSEVQNRNLSKGFALPSDFSFTDVHKQPPVVMATDILPALNNPEFDSLVAQRFGIDLNARPANSIGILHSRFRNADKQLNLSSSDRHVVSLYGNAESGVGVLEYVSMPSPRKYFSSADSVVQIKTDGESAGVGTGTLISKDGMVATAAHVIDGGGDILVYTKHGLFAADIIAKEYSDTHDIAALQLRDVPEGLSFPVPGMTSANLSKGSRAATVGHPQGLSGQFASVGSYVGVVDYTKAAIDGEYPTFLMDTAMPGNSGGPIFDHQGNLSVILSRIFTPKEGTYLRSLNRGLALGNRIEDLQQLLKENNIAPFNS